MSSAHGGDVVRDRAGDGGVSAVSASAISMAATPGDLRDLLHALHEARLLEPIDVQLADMIVRRGNEQGERGVALALAAACTSRARREGHSAVALDQLVSFARLVEGSLASPARARGEPRGAARTLPRRAPRPVPLADEAPPAADDSRSLLGGVTFGDAEWWRQQLAASPQVGDGTTMTALVLRGDLLQFKRYHEAEVRIAEFVQQRVTAPEGGPVKWFSIITGGPGTGKTTRVAETLLELTQRAPQARIALAAPTGKAAARLTESIRQRMDAVARETGQRGEMPGEARTLHRLLGYSPQTDTFRSNRSDPLDDDLVIVDEASMMDVLMLEALLRALKPGARLMLVGDHNQLASVDAGDVLGALCRSAQSGVPGSPLYDSVTWLEKSWRFADHPGIGTLAAAILAGDVSQMLAVCEDPAMPEVAIRPSAPTTEALLEPVLPSLQRCLDAPSPHDLLQALDAIRILAPEREGRMGVYSINASVERWLARHGHPVQEQWYHRRPVLVTANDYATGVYNGDVGVVWRDGASGRVAVHFRTNDGTIRAIAPSRLPAVETAWAMTVHKAQGSEFDHVLVVVPDGESRVMSRELLYTAATRARRGVTIVGNPAVLRQAVGRRTGRTSGLGERLREAQSGPAAAPGATAGA
ncbi:MAG: exodeoxyribonuclease V subunit alpha [Gemmatimonadetes bacterium]|nr:exodeoxyribonuclease V subunit alpha [Gemmatimonadota bacterium]MCC6773762.1 exodeoxyribonuclease V subunit alpha [Gemmatimonadaceae bacterium]